MLRVFLIFISLMTNPSKSWEKVSKMSQEKNFLRKQGKISQTSLIILLGIGLILIKMPRVKSEFKNLKYCLDSAGKAPCSNRLIDWIKCLNSSIKVRKVISPLKNSNNSLSSNPPQTIQQFGGLSIYQVTRIT